MLGTPPDDLEAEITQAKKKLAEFEAGASWSELTARLQRSNPMHPFLLVRTLAFGGMAVCAVVLLCTMGGSVFSRDIAEMVGKFEAAVFVPFPLLMSTLAMALAFGGVLGWAGAVSAGREAPYLPHEAKVHQRLTSDVLQLEAKRTVKERMTPKPATPRLLDRRGR